MNFPFHLVAAPGLLLALGVVFSRPSPFSAARAAIGYLLLGAVSALFLCRGGFDLIALAAYGLFLYGVLFLVGVAAILARSRMRAARAGALAAAACALGLAAVAVDAFVVEPRALELRRVAMTSAKVTRPLRIAVLADLQTDQVGLYERAAIRRLLAQRPDLIVMPGDYVQSGGGERQDVLARRLRKLLHEEGWSAPRGVVAVRGNCEWDDWPRMFDGLPVTVFERTSTVVRDDLAITGLTLEDSFAGGLVIAGRPQFHVVVGHGPDYALSERVGADLLIAGHTHGGQVRLPFYGPPLTLSKVPRAWAGGGTMRLDGGRTLVVSRGVGMERGHAPRIRFLCRPEIVIVDVEPAEG